MHPGLRRLVLVAALGVIAPVSLAYAGTPNGVADAQLNGLQWRLLGPFRGGWATMAAGIPDQPNTFYFGAAGGGVWKT
ncbi:MAG: hypothetical protein ABIO74_03995, partial [Dokdonella sp.]